MSFKNIASKIAKFAPLLGGVLGGPGGSAIGGLVANALGVDNTESAISKALLDPNAAIKLKELELEHKAELKKIHLDTTRIELADKANAREAHKHSRMPALITMLLTILATAYGCALFSYDIPPDNKDMVNYFGGQLVTLWVSSVVYWVGTTRSSAEKDKSNLKR